MPSVRSKHLELARARNWSEPFARGFVDGEALRRRGKPLPRFSAVARDDYSEGFRAGYFGRLRAPDLNGKSHEATG